MEGMPRLSHAKLDVYRCALEFLEIVHQISKAMPAGNAELKGQLDDAASSMVLNIAEGAGRTTRGDKRKHYGIARGSAIESSAALDICLIRELAAPPLVRKGLALLVRIVGMLTRMSL